MRIIKLVVSEILVFILWLALIILKPVFYMVLINRGNDSYCSGDKDYFVTPFIYNDCIYYKCCLSYSMHYGIGAESSENCYYHMSNITPNIELKTYNLETMNLNGGFYEWFPRVVILAALSPLLLTMVL